MENNTPPPIPSPRSTPSAAKPYNSGEPASPRGNGRGWILALAILQTIGGIVLFAMSAQANPDSANSIVLVVTLGLSALFFGLWIWGKTAPFAALLTALIVFVTFHLLDAVLDPATIFRGIIVKIVLLSGLATATKRAYTKKREAELQAAA
jgi:hypothetical protein